MIKYPVYIVSKGRAYNPLTAKAFKRDNVPFKIVVEPQEYDEYKQVLGAENVIKLPFSNLGLGSYPARNFCWEHSIENGADRHWCFDDNIMSFGRINKGIRVRCNALTAIKTIEEFTDRYQNIGISGFNYYYFVSPQTKKPFYLNCHVYSAMLILNNTPFRWRLRYNEDVDLCLQFLMNKYCTVLFNALWAQKTQTTAKMKGGNQDELYLGNREDKKVKKVRTLEEIWPDIVKATIKWGRPHHHVDWKKLFHHPLIRREDIDFDSFPKVDNKGLSLKGIDDVKNPYLRGKAKDL